jgi:cobalt/nickel transport system permease protein
MHIPNAELDPRVAVATGLIGMAGLAYGLRALERRMGERTIVLMGTTAAFVFAAQMVNFPVGPCSGHLIGGVLAATLLGPWGGAVVIAAVLIVQCLLFGDGGLTALGANFVNMGLIGAVGGYAIYAPIRRAVGGPRGVILGAMAAAWFSVLLAAGAFSVEFAVLGRRADFARVLTWMTLVHAVIGLGEAVITGLALRFILLTRPDLIHDPKPDEGGLLAGAAKDRLSRWWQVGAAGLAVSLAVGLLVAPFASSAPDGLEYVGQQLGFMKGEAPATLPVPIPDYDARVLTGLSSLRLATAVAGGIGTVVVFAVAIALGGVFARPGTASGGKRAPARDLGPVPREVEVTADAT